MLSKWHGHVKALDEKYETKFDYVLFWIVKQIKPKKAIQQKSIKPKPINDGVCVSKWVSECAPKQGSSNNSTSVFVYIALFFVSFMIMVIIFYTWTHHNFEYSYFCIVPFRFVSFHMLLVCSNERARTCSIRLWLVINLTKQNKIEETKKREEKQKQQQQKTRQKRKREKNSVENAGALNRKVWTIESTEEGSALFAIYARAD